MAREQCNIKAQTQCINIFPVLAATKKTAATQKKNHPLAAKRNQRKDEETKARTDKNAMKKMRRQHRSDDRQGRVCLLFQCTTQILRLRTRRLKAKDLSSIRNGHIKR